MPTPSPLSTLVGHMKVEQLARLVGLGVPDLVEAVMGSSPVHHAPRVASLVRPRTSDDHASTPPVRPPGRQPHARTSGLPAAVSEPPLAAMFGNVTHRELHRVVDQWLFAQVLLEERGNVTHLARRLGVSRRTSREHRDRVLDASLQRWIAPGARPPAAPFAPTPPSLMEVLRSGGGYRDIRDAVDRWLIGGILAREQGNVSAAARKLKMSRKDLRLRWQRVQR